MEDLVEVGQDLLGLCQHEELLDVVIEAARGVEHCLEMGDEWLIEKLMFITISN